MKRSPLSRGSGLARRSSLRRSRPAPRRDEPGYAEWKTPRQGSCTVCGANGLIFRHHILYERQVRLAGRPELAYDLRNALDIGAPETCSCHHDQHWAVRRIPLALISQDARAFAAEVLGAGPAQLWLDRYYSPLVDLRERRQSART